MRFPGRGRPWDAGFQQLETPVRNPEGSLGHWECPVKAQQEGMPGEHCGKTGVHFLSHALPSNVPDQLLTLLKRSCTNLQCPHPVITEGFAVVKHFPRLKDYSGLELEIRSFSCSNKPLISFPECVSIALSYLGMRKARLSFWGWLHYLNELVDYF